ncbi:hypothetical protein [Thiothrix litoralis]|nr:hypothetical protein [Thiothrix litoralis]
MPIAQIMVEVLLLLLLLPLGQAMLDEVTARFTPVGVICSLA